MPAIRELTDEADRRAAVPLLRQLWTDRSVADVLDWTADDDYRLYGRFTGGDLVGVVGFRRTSVLHHADHVWVSDLVVDEPHRENGHGSALLDFVEEWADERGCAYVALASPLAKERVHDYYEGREYGKWGYVLEKEV